MISCSVEEATRLLQSGHSSIKIHLKKRGDIIEKKLSSNEESVFNYTVELNPCNEPLGLVVGEDMKVTGIEKNGLCWRFQTLNHLTFSFRTGSICIGDRIISIDGCEVNQPAQEVQQFLNEQTENSLSLGMTRRLQIAPRLDPLKIMPSTPSRQNSMSDVHRSSTPSFSAHGRLNLIDIQKVIGAMATSIQNKEHV